LKRETRAVVSDIERMTDEFEGEIERLRAEVARLRARAERAEADLDAILDFLICQENSEDFRCSAIFYDARFSSRAEVVRFIREAAGLDAAPAGDRRSER
jgi:hypothetical protein